MLKNTVYIIFLLFIISLTAFSAGDYCKTRYPILLVHGISASGRTPGVKYWGGIPQALRDEGAVVYLSGQKLYASHSDNAKLLKKRVQYILALEKTDKINLIAHSKGGIEARYMISRLNMADSTASLTTVCTPHRGSSTADLVYSEIYKNRHLAYTLASAAVLLGALSGDERSDPFIAGAQLSCDYMSEFNKKVENDPRVYYQSYTSKIDETYPSYIWKEMYKALYAYEGPNDGLVSVESAKWGNFRGIITVEGHSHLSHIDVISLSPVNKVDDVKMQAFYKDMAHELKEMGY